MKKFLFVALLFVAAQSGLFAQANVTSSAISVQGIARNDLNNAVASSTIAVTAELYYFNSSAPTTPVTILSRTGNVTTDAFGVFAYVVDIGSADFVKIANSEAWIKISSNNIVFAQEKLMTVPYAIHSQNGAPTGSIMPYVGSTAPAGWLLCDGSTIPTGDAYTALKTILGSGGSLASNVPDLRGMFIRGAGTNAVNTYANNVGPTIKTIQADGVVNHTHAFTSSSATTSTNGSHGHTVPGNAGGATTQANAINYDRTLGNGDEVNYPIPAAGDHSHTVTVSGTTNNQSGGLSETRPVNYGVNYIIKI